VTSFCFFLTLGFQTSDKTILYSVANTLVNCTNSYDVKEVVPELVQLAKFSKQHVPEEHPKVGTGAAQARSCVVIETMSGLTMTIVNFYDFCLLIF
jgi:hypothetical protein